MRHRLLSLLGALGVTMATAVVGIATAPAAEAAGSCWYAKQVYAPGYGTRPAYYCTNRYAAPVYSVVHLGYPHTYGRMYSTTSWFVCQVGGGPNPVTYNSDGSRNTNHYWLYTQADTVVQTNGSKWGYMPATYVNQGGNDQPVPGVPYC